MAMINIDEIIKEKKLTANLLIQVHDELVYEVKEEEFDTLKVFSPILRW